VAQYTSFNYGEPSPSVRSNSDISRIFDGNSSQLFIDWDWITEANTGPINNSVNTIIWSYGSSTSLAYHGGNYGSATLVFGGSTGFTTSPSSTNFIGCTSNADCNGQLCDAARGVCLCSSSALGSTCEVAASSSEETCFNNGGRQFCMQAVIVDQFAYMRFRAETQGWLAFMYDSSPVDGMSGDPADVWVFTWSNGICSGIDMLSTSVTRPVSDAAGNDLQDVRCYQDDTGSTVTFRRRLDTGNYLEDKVIVNADVACSWAMGFDTEPSLVIHQVQNRGKLVFNFFLGSGSQSAAVAKTQFIVPCAAILLAVVVYNLLSCCGHTAYLQRRPMKATARKDRCVLDPVFLNFCETIQDLTNGEWMLLTLYIVTVVAFTLVSIANASKGGRALYFTSGHVAQLHLALLFLPVTRNSVWVPLLGASFERAVKFHRWLGRLALLSTVAHLLTMYNLHPTFDFFSLDPIPSGLGVIWGTLSLISMGIMSVGALEYIRRKHFEYFYTLHLLALPLVVVFAILHNTDMWMYFVGPVGLWLFDRLIRFCRSRQSASVIRAATLGPDHERVTVLVLRKDGMRFEAGDFVFLNFPDISVHEWHPFSISCGPHAENFREGYFSVHIKDMGNHTFTNKLSSLVQKGALKLVRVDGPHGKLTVSPYTCEHVFLVCGGIGVTPLMSILDELVYVVHAGQSRVKSVTMLWTNQNCSAFSLWFQELLGSAPVRALVEQGALKLMFYCTRADELQILQETKEAFMKPPTDPIKTTNEDKTSLITNLNAAEAISRLTNVYAQHKAPLKSKRSEVDINAVQMVRT
jgi:ferric-chelate reductase